MMPEKTEEIISSFLDNLEKAIVSKYHQCIISTGKLYCEMLRGEVGAKGKVVFRVNHYNLNDACTEIKKDILFLLKRRAKLIDLLKPSFGKIAGIISYRLAKSHIVHLCEGCLGCSIRCASKLNTEFALRCAWEYIGIQYLRVPAEVRKELFYSFSYRHINQETLGLVFDTVFFAYKIP